MEPQEFFEYFVDHWELTPAELAELLGKKRDSIYLWFSVSGEAQRSPPADVIKILRLIHFIWQRWEQEEEALPYPVRSIYEQAKERKELKRRTEPVDEDCTDIALPSQDTH